MAPKSSFTTQQHPSAERGTHSAPTPEQTKAPMGDRSMGSRKAPETNIRLNTRKGK